jgi:hypothetical protein
MKEIIYYVGIFEDEAGIFYNIEENKIPSCPGANLIAVYQGELIEIPEIVEEVETITEELKRRRQ